MQPELQHESAQACVKIGGGPGDDTVPGGGDVALASSPREVAPSAASSLRCTETAAAALGSYTRLALMARAAKLAGYRQSGGMAAPDVVITPVTVVHGTLKPPGGEKLA